MLIIVDYNDIGWKQPSCERTVIQTGTDDQRDSKLTLYWQHQVFKEFRVVGQTCSEGMDESGILPKARYAMTVFDCLD